MRPSTFAEACRRAQAGEPFDLALGNFLQAYYLAPDIEARVPMLHDEPPGFDDRRYDALVGGIAEYLFKRWAAWLSFLAGRHIGSRVARAISIGRGGRLARMIRRLGSTSPGRVRPSSSRATS